MCEHLPDSFADAGEYYSACLTCGEVLAQHSFTRPTLAQRLKLLAAKVGVWAAEAASFNFCQLKWNLLYLCLPELCHNWIGDRQRREHEAQHIPKLPIRFAILASLEKRYPQASDEVARRILLVDKALELRLSRGSWG